MLLPVDKMCNIDLKDAYSVTPLSVESRNYVKFQWKGLLYEFCFLCFGFSPAPLVFTKLSKVPISLLRKLNVTILIYLGAMLLMSSSLRDLLMARDTLIVMFRGGEKVSHKCLGAQSSQISYKVFQISH